MLNSFGAKANTVSLASFIIVLLSAAQCRMVSVSLGWLSKPPPPLSMQPDSPNAYSMMAAKSGNSSHFSILPLPSKIHDEAFQVSSSSFTLPFHTFFHFLHFFKNLDVHINLNIELVNFVKVAFKVSP
jgi:hypothetical protein